MVTHCAKKLTATCSLRLRPSQGVLGNKATEAFIREQGIFSIYFQGTRKLLSRFLGTREHQFIFSNILICSLNIPSPLNIKSIMYLSVR